MSARCHPRRASFTRRLGARSIIVACTCALGLAGSPRLHEYRNHPAPTRASHSYAATSVETGKLIKGIGSNARPMVTSQCTIQAAQEFPILNPVWVPGLFLAACLCEHGPPI